MPSHLAKPRSAKGKATPDTPPIKSSTNHTDALRAVETTASPITARQAKRRKIKSSPDPSIPLSTAVSAFSLSRPQADHPDQLPRSAAPKRTTVPDPSLIIEISSGSDDDKISGSSTDPEESESESESESGSGSQSESESGSGSGSRSGSASDFASQSASDSESASESVYETASEAAESEAGESVHEAESASESASAASVCEDECESASESASESTGSARSAVSRSESASASTASVAESESAKSAQSAVSRSESARSVSECESEAAESQSVSASESASDPDEAAQSAASRSESESESASGSEPESAPSTAEHSSNEASDPKSKGSTEKKTAVTTPTTSPSHTNRQQSFAQFSKQYYKSPRNQEGDSDDDDDEESEDETQTSPDSPDLNLYLSYLDTQNRTTHLESLERDLTRAQQHADSFKRHVKSHKHRHKRAIKNLEDLTTKMQSIRSVGRTHPEYTELKFIKEAATFIRGDLSESELYLSCCKAHIATLKTRACAYRDLRGCWLRLWVAHEDMNTPGSSRVSKLVSRMWKKDGVGWQVKTGIEDAEAKLDKAAKEIREFDQVWGQVAAEADMAVEGGEGAENAENEDEYQFEYEDEM